MADTLLVPKNSPVCIFLRHKEFIINEMKLAGKIGVARQVLGSRAFDALMGAQDAILATGGTHLFRNLFRQQAARSDNTSLKVIPSYIDGKVVPVSIVDVIQLKLVIEAARQFVKEEASKSKTQLTYNPLTREYGRVTLPNETLSGMLGIERVHLLSLLPEKHREDRISIDRFLRIASGEFFVDWRNEPAHWNEVYLPVESRALCAYYNACVNSVPGVPAIELALTDEKKLHEKPYFVVPPHAEGLLRIRQARHIESQQDLTDHESIPANPEYAVVFLEGMLEAVLHLYSQAVMLNLKSDGDVL